jgi:predicted lactoylglutathione lyase
MIGAEVGKAMLAAGSFKVFQKFYVAAISVQKNRQSCVISLIQMSRQEAQTVVQSCGVTLCR